MSSIEDKLVIKQIYINTLKDIKSSLTSVTRQLGFSLEYVNTSVESLIEKGSIEVDNQNNYHLTKLGRKQISVILTGGTFDILHVGHLFTFNQSKLLGDVLVVILATDKNVEKLKKHPPTNSQKDRAEIVEYVKGVDAAIVGDETDFMKMIDIVNCKVEREDEAVAFIVKGTYNNNLFHCRLELRLENNITSEADTEYEYIDGVDLNRLDALGELVDEVFETEVCRDVFEKHGLEALLD